ncbi:MAG: hypothetical protein U9R51_07885 [Actinomycetota bacterium]|nr:hypothetical protein [Actinomycetota bacterium]
MASTQKKRVTLRGLPRLFLYMAHSSLPNPLDDLRSYANDLVDAAPDLDASSLLLADGPPVPKRPHHFTVPAMALMGVAAMLFIAQVGVAVVANSAVPGDQFYGLDLLVEDALTTVGVPIDVASERIDEAEVLLERNELDEAIRTTRVAYREMDPPVIGATVAHLVRAETLLTDGTDPAIDEAVSSSLANLLKTTKEAGSIEVGDARAINDAALQVARAAGLDEGGAP